MKPDLIERNKLPSNLRIVSTYLQQRDASGVEDPMKLPGQVGIRKSNPNISGTLKAAYL